MMLFWQIFESTGIQILTDLRFINDCETITDAVDKQKYENEVTYYGTGYVMDSDVMESDIVGRFGCKYDLTLPSL